MILFYSEYCEHCNLLLETIKRHDTEGIIKLVSIDLLKSLKKDIDARIHSVPALMFPNTKEIIFGKQVFDHLLLPNRGILFANKITRDKGDDDNINKNIKINTNSIEKGEPLAFSLGTIVSENYASIDDNDNNSLNVINNNKNYRWSALLESDNKDDKNSIQSLPQPEIKDVEKKDVEKNKGKLPSLEEIMQSRENDIR